MSKIKIAGEEVNVPASLIIAAGEAAWLWFLGEMVSRTAASPGVQVFGIVALGGIGLAVPFVYLAWRRKRREAKETPKVEAGPSAELRAGDVHFVGTSVQGGAGGIHGPGGDVTITGGAGGVQRLPLRADPNDLLLNLRWNLIFNPESPDGKGEKEIAFGADYHITKGLHENEARWKRDGSELVIVRADGTDHNRFRWVRSAHRWESTDDPAVYAVRVHRIRGQRIEILNGAVLRPTRAQATPVDPRQKIARDRMLAFLNEGKRLDKSKDPPVERGVIIAWRDKVAAFLADCFGDAWKDKFLDAGAPSYHGLLNRKVGLETDDIPPFQLTIPGPTIPAQGFVFGMVIQKLCHSLEEMLNTMRAIDIRPTWNPAPTERVQGPSI